MISQHEHNTAGKCSQIFCIRQRQSEIHVRVRSGAFLPGSQVQRKLTHPFLAKQNFQPSFFALSGKFEIFNNIIFPRRFDRRNFPRTRKVNRELENPHPFDSVRQPALQFERVVTYSDSPILFRRNAGLNGINRQGT